MSEMDVSKIFPGWSAEGVLGSGEFGTVYLIRNAENGAFSSMKVIRVPPTPEAIDNAVKMGVGRDLLATYFTKFKNDLSWEIAMYGNVKNPALAPVEELKTASLSGPGWLGFMRSGIYTPISIYFEKTASTPDDAARMGMELAGGLEALAQYSMVHGDIKPANVMVTDAGSFVLTDFALRRCLERAGSGIFDAASEGFDAPETEGRDRVYSVRSDIYSLGALMCWTANGGSMPEHGDPNKIKNMDPALAAVIRKAMAADPNQRYQTAAQMKADLLKLNLPKKQARRAMAAAAAFEAVKRNGGAVMTGAKSAAKTGDKPAEESAGTAYDFSDTGKNPKKSEKDAGVKKSKAGWVVGLIAMLACLAVVLVIWIPWKTQSPPDNVVNNDDGQNTGDDGQNAGDDGQNTGDDGQNAGDDGQNAGDDGQNAGDDGQNAGDDGQNAGDDGQNVGDDGQNAGDDGQNAGDDGQNTGNGGQTTGNGGQTTGNGGQTTGNGGQATGNGGQTTGNGGQNTGNGGQTTGTTRPKPTNNDVLYPSDTQRITREELEGKTRAESYMLINEIYARHGYIFKSGGEAEKYFNTQKWYTPVTSNAAKVEAKFNAVEKDNLNTLMDYQREMGWRAGEPSTTTPGGTTDPTPGGTTDPTPGETTDPNPGETTDPNPGETTDPNPGETTDPNPGETTDPNPGETTDPNPGGTTDPNPGETTDPNPGGTTDPNPGGTTDPNPGETTDPNPGETTEPAENVVLFPSDTQLVTRADLEGRSREEVTLMINEIYARHGYIFTNASIKAHFEAQRWYTPVTGNISTVVSMLNDTEKANVAFINGYMKEQGWR